mmetsp:Transcript_31882/g.101518  ORF Transcript_31882/g.101518 Transcript_31882/m.101518 type:complete len:171 (+) Transcript_31882:586-1098(+)
MELLTVFWDRFDPTQRNRQGNDVGTQYRSGIYYLSEAQKAFAEASKEAEAQQYALPIATEVVPAETFWPAEKVRGVASRILTPTPTLRTRTPTPVPSLNPDPNPNPNPNPKVPPAILGQGRPVREERGPHAHPLLRLGCVCASAFGDGFRSGWVGVLRPVRGVGHGAESY